MEPDGFEMGGLVSRQCIIRHAKRYSFTDDKTAEKKEAVVCQLEFGLLPENSENRKGNEVAVINFPYDEWCNLSQVPGRYEIETQDTVMKGVVRPVGVRIVRRIAQPANGGTPAPGASKPSTVRA